MVAHRGDTHGERDRRDLCSASASVSPDPVVFEALGIYLPLVAVNAIVVAWIAGDGLVVAPAKTPLMTAIFAAVCAFATLVFVGFINGMLTTGQGLRPHHGRELAASPIAAFGKPTELAAGAGTRGRVRPVRRADVRQGRRCRCDFLREVSANGVPERAVYRQLSITTWCSPSSSAWCL
ncbi:MAG: hypothetical protein ACLTSX_11965 [Collinsella sp.]